ncbi:antibiotic biosynthesis monooxygenase [Marivirga atlantica]|jgi:heme-degrading monooxygenase HmoA|uniref:Antibiotic biosynthesis monooxygenase n=1 Tax=Marivirga atlantica TaxID=1548457 RepID=A0A937A7W6_9BACT|nr:antibiotic biosynthesis monooxygenase [Marivirga atlantica]MBL0763991.1 antibiotic biosynthesis monooxygenase [Marivirga atlantica]
MINSELPYYAVIFTSVKTNDDKGYQQMADLMERLASEQKGFLGIESARNEIGITVSYWKSLEAIKLWKAHIDHQAAQKLGREKWYASYTVRIAKVEKEYSHEK